MGEQVAKVFFSVPKILLAITKASLYYTGCLDVVKITLLIVQGSNGESECVRSHQNDYS